MDLAQSARPPAHPVHAPAYPLHVILAAYPITCFTGAFLTDIAYAGTYEMQWRTSLSG